MAIFSSLAGFFNRNKRRIFITSAVTFSIYLLVNEFVIKKFRNYQNAIRQEFMFKQQIRQRFILTQQDCYYTILALLPVLAQPIVDALPVDLITQALRLKKGQQNQPQAASGSNSELTTDNLSLLENNNNPQLQLSVYMNKSKAELWDLLKTKTITRTLTLMYSISGLLLISRLQMNILARRSYLESAIVMAGVKNPNNDIDPHENYIIEQSYLSLSWWLLNKGWANLSSLIENLVVEKFKTISPRSEIGVFDFELILTEIIEDINTNNKQYVLDNLFPIKYPDLLETILNTNSDVIHQLDIPDSNLTKLINETSSIMSDNNLYFFDLLNQLIVTNLQTLTSNLSSSLSNTSNSLMMSDTLPGQQQQQQQSQESKVIELDNKPYKLASFLAQLSVQNGVMINNDDASGSNTEEDDIEDLIKSLESGQGFTGDGYGAHELGGNVYINTLNNLDELENFSAGIYSNFE